MLASAAQASARENQISFPRLVLLKIDGLNADLLYEQMRQTDPATGRSRLPWLSRVFGEGGTVFDNFYVRGISLSAPSWSILDTGHHAVIRGNVEYDRYTGQVYDYLNFFPFYIGYARKQDVDMPGVQVLDRAGIPLLIDQFQPQAVLQSFQLFQRGVRWTTLKDALIRGFSSTTLGSILENSGPSLGPALGKETEGLLESGVQGSSYFYLDLFTGDIDHEGHATNNPEAMLHLLKQVDALVGRIWSAIEAGPLARQTLFVVVSDHGMNNVPGVVSQTFSLPDLLNSPAGGAHHVVTDREQLSNFKLKGINPLVHRVVTPSRSSFYLAGRASDYPTAWLDLDGNERAAVHLRSSDLNKIHILLLQLSRTGLDAPTRKVIALSLIATVDRHRTEWTESANEMEAELGALDRAIQARKQLLRKLPKKDVVTNSDRLARRLRQELQAWESEHSDYAAYTRSVRALLALDAENVGLQSREIRDLVPPMALGDNNTVYDLENYVVGPSPEGMIVDANGKLDEARSFLYVNYFPLLTRQTVRNNPQPELSSHPVDFVAMALSGKQIEGWTLAPQHAYWLYSNEEAQLLILEDVSQGIKVIPVSHLTESATGKIDWTPTQWKQDLPLKLFEDSGLELSPGVDRASWLSSWHTEQEWFKAIHRCRYSNGVIGISEELSPIEELVPGSVGADPLMRRYEQRRRKLVRSDFEVFAADHWNFNVRFPNPGGNHGSFLRISTHSVWMMAGAGIPVRRVEQPYDSLNFASTLLAYLGKATPMPDRVVNIQ